MFKILPMCVLLLTSFVGYAQEEYKGIPEDLAQEKIIFLNYEPINISDERPRSKEDRYIRERKEQHNMAAEQANDYLRTSALDYPYKYAIANHSTYKNLVEAGYKYVLECNCFNNERLMKSPESGVLLIYDFYIKDLTTGDIYLLFDLDEMKVYDYRLVMKKLNKLVNKSMD